MQNALILMRSQTTPYIIDPSTQATEWLKNNLTKSNAKLEVVTQQDPRFNNALELAVRFGKTLVIQEADQIEPIIYPLIRRDLTRQGPRCVFFSSCLFFFVENIHIRSKMGCSAWRKDNRL
jgi:dynein heavy chain 2